jgi:hypothetical protein
MAWGVVAVVALGGSAANAGTDSPDLEWRHAGDGDLVLSATTEVELVSNSDTDLDVAITVELGSLTLTDGEQVDGTAVVHVPDTVQVPARQAVPVEIVVIGLSGIDLKQGGRGVIVATSGEIMAELPFQLEAVAEPTAEPVAETWTTTILRDFCGDDSIKGNRLPLTAAYDGTLPPVLGVLQDDDGDEVTVTGKLSDDRRFVTLSFDHAERGTTYTGTVDLLPADDEAGTATLTLRSTDTKWLAAAVIAVGVFLGLVAKRVVSVDLVINSLRKQLDRKRKQAEDAETRFQLKYPGSTWSILNSVAAVDEEGKAAVRRLGGWVLSIDTSSPDLAAARAAIVKLGTAADLWGTTAADEMKALNAAADNINSTYRTAAPKLHATAVKHLRGRAISVDDIAAERANTVALASSLTEFQPIRTELDARRDALAAAAALNGLSWHDRVRIESARRDIAAVTYRLWIVEAVDELVALRVDERIAAADEVIGSVIGQRPGAPVPRARSLAPELLALDSATVMSAVTSEAAGAVLGKFASAVTRFTGLAIRGFGAVIAVAIALVGGVTTGLTEVYSDGPFGTASDYLRALVWGTATVVVLQALESVVSAVNSSTGPAPATSTVSAVEETAK